MSDATPNAPVPASERATAALARQRERHAPDDVETDDEGVGALVNNTGLDGDAASG
jgi:hypothetical protein